MFNPFKRLPNEQIDAFSRALAQDLAARYAPDLDPQPTEKKSQRRLGRALDQVYAKARDFHAEHRLGVYGKARLGNAFKWELRELGYATDFVEEATRGLILSMSGK